MVKRELPQCSGDKVDALRRLMEYLSMCRLVLRNEVRERSPEWYWIRYIAIGISKCLDELSSELLVSTLPRLKELAKILDAGMYSRVDDSELINVLHVTCSKLMELVKHCLSG